MAYRRRSAKVKQQQQQQQQKRTDYTENSCVMFYCLINVSYSFLEVSVYFVLQRYTLF